MREPVFRLATDADRDGIRDVVGTVLREYGLRPDPEGEDADLDSIETSYLSAGGRFWVLNDRTGAIVGAVGVMRMDDETCELRKMYLLPAWRSRGLGRMMLEEAMRFARSAGFVRMRLTSHDNLTEALALYRAHGFTERPWESHNPARCTLLLERDL